MATGAATDGGSSKAPPSQTGDTAGRVIGENVKRLREARRLTQHETVRLLRSVGVSISQPRVAALERGDRETVDVATLLLLAAAFDVPVSAFFAGRGRVQLSPMSRQSRAGIRRLLSSPDTWQDLEHEDQPETMRFTRAAVEADVALADRLDVSPRRVVEAAARLWGQSLTEERDRRVAALGDLGPGERQVRRGLVTRELAQHVEQVIEHDRLLTEWRDKVSTHRTAADQSAREFDQFRGDTDNPAVVDAWLADASRRAADDVENALTATRSRMRVLGVPLPPLPEGLSHLRESDDEATEDDPLRELAQLSEPLGDDEAAGARDRTDDRGQQ